MDNQEDIEVKKTEEIVEGEQLDEISKERVSSYAVKALASRAKADADWSDAQKRKHKAGDAARNVKRNGPDTDYGETKERHAERVATLEKRRANAEKDVAKADKTQQKRNSGLMKAGRRLAKEEIEMEDQVIETIEEGTAAEASLHPAAKSVSDPSSKTAMIASVMAAMHLTPTTELTKWFNDTMAQFGPGKTYGVGDNSAKNSSTIDTTLGKGPKTKDSMPKLSVKEDVVAMFAGEELSEEFQEKATTLFEAAVNARVIAEMARLEEEYEAALNEEIESIGSEIEKKVDSYLDYVVEQWLEENEVAIESALRNELMEEFMEGLKNLFAEHYINIPNEKIDVLEALAEKVESLEGKLDEMIIENANLKESLIQEEAAAIFEEYASDLALTQKEKFSALAEGIEFGGDVEILKKKLSVIKETYFGKSNESASAGTNIEEEFFENDEVKTVSIDPAVNRYVAALSRTVK